MTVYEKSTKVYHWRATVHRMVMHVKKSKNPHMVKPVVRNIYLDTYSYKFDLIKWVLTLRFISLCNLLNCLIYSRCSILQSTLYTYPILHEFVKIELATCDVAYKHNPGK